MTDEARVYAIIEALPDEAQRLLRNGNDGSLNEVGGQFARTVDGLLSVPQPEATEGGDDPIPRYAQLDIWMALSGDSLEYDAERDRIGFAEMWARLCSEVRAARPVPVQEDGDDDALRLLREFASVAPAAGQIVPAIEVHRLAVAVLRKLNAASPSVQVESETAARLNKAIRYLDGRREAGRSHPILSILRGEDDGLYDDQLAPDPAVPPTTDREKP